MSASIVSDRKTRAVTLAQFLRRLLTILTLLFVLCPAAHAQSCSASVATVNFGSFSPIAQTALATTGTVAVTCTWPAITVLPSVLVCLNLTAPTPRQLLNGTNTIAYDLYTDAGHSLAWGATSAGTTPLQVTLNKPAGTTATANVSFYGQITANQPLVPSAANSNTVYTQNITAGQTSLNAGFYLLIGPTCASLTTSSGSFPFSANTTVINNCNITATGLAFTSTSTLNSVLNTAGSLQVQCTNNDAYRISLSTGSSNTFSSRTMKSSAGAAVQYQLYTDAARSIIWGDGTSGSTMYTNTGTGAVVSVPVYGRVPVQTAPPPGSYSDTITATISF